MKRLLLGNKLQYGDVTYIYAHSVRSFVPYFSCWKHGATILNKASGIFNTYTFEMRIKVENEGNIKEEYRSEQLIEGSRNQLLSLSLCL